MSTLGDNRYVKVAYLTKAKNVNSMSSLLSFCSVPYTHMRDQASEGGNELSGKQRVHSADLPAGIPILAVIAVHRACLLRYQCRIIRSHVVMYNLNTTTPQCLLRRWIST